MARPGRHQYLIRFAYDGQRFFGVSPQRDHPTVGATLYERLEEAAGQRPRALQFTARTDTGVSAEENFATCWFLEPFEPADFEAQFQQKVGGGITSVSATAVDIHVHARNISSGKWYRYMIRTDGNDDPRAWGVEGALDVNAMESLAAQFIGSHDFSAFRWRCSAPNTMKTLTRVEITPVPTGYIIDVEGDGFLRRMVRKLVGAIIWVGLGEATVEDVASLIDSGVNYGAPHGAPAHGLTLMAVLRKEG
jgi:tRNA pseudouridine38-40 synthase